MSEIVEIIDTLEIKIVKLVNKIQTLQKKNQELQINLDKTTINFENQSKNVQQLEKDFESLKMANSLLGSDEYKRETKLKINTLVREIDHCIAQLSD
ncbi:MAG: chromosome segregation ATPase [Flavobacterium sp.]|jgi:chromosome segregation ATPase